MINRISRKEIIDNYEKYSNRFTVISFDGDSGKRELTYGGLDLFLAFAEVQSKLSGGKDVYIFVDLPYRLSIPQTINDLTDEHDQYTWKPEYNEFR